MARNRETEAADVGDCPEVVVLLVKEPRAVTGGKDGLLAAFGRIRRLKRRLPGLKIVASHDFAADVAVSQATRNSSRFLRRIAQ